MRKTHFVLTVVSWKITILGTEKEVTTVIKSLMFRCATVCKFASSSLLSFALDYCLFLLFSAVTGNWTWGLLLSNIAARLVSACFNYSLNKYLVFHGGGQVSQDLPQYVLLAAGILAGYLYHLFHKITAAFFSRYRERKSSGQFPNLFPSRLTGKG